MILVERLLNSRNGHEKVLFERPFLIRFRDIKESELKRLGIKTDVLIISDSHAGSHWGRLDWVATIAESVGSHVLLLSGDIFALDNPRHVLRVDELKNMARIKAACMPPRKGFIQVGNHDQEQDSVHLFAMGVQQIFAPYYWEANGTRVAVVHGHEYRRDTVPSGLTLLVASFVIPIVYALGDEYLYQFQEIGGRVFRMGTKVQNSLAGEKGPDADVIIYGHVHRREVSSRKGKILVNGGCCIKDRINFTTLDSSGITVYKIQLGK